MSAAVLSCPVPPESAINEHLPGAYFHDCYGIEVAGAPRSALGYFLAAVAATPGWVNALMAVRNKLVRLVGLKDLGHLGDFDPGKPASAYAPGDRIGIFTLLADSDTETLMGIRDKHLDVLLSVCKRSAARGERTPIAVTTVVHVHNLLGRLYMLPVTPMHKVIAPTVVARMVEA
jgi:Protein of unknown function (DUF2867)